MMKTNFIKKIIVGRLTELCSNTFFGNIPQDSTFPRISLSINETGSNGIGFQEYILTVTAYDKDTFSNLDSLTDTIEKSLDRYVYENPLGIAKVYSSHEKISIMDNNSIAQCVQKFKITLIEKEMY
ncbi:MAG: hypothetical protein ACI4WH_07705 [Oscillospiraceae bacterium]